MALKFTTPIANTLPDSLDAGLVDVSLRVSYQRDSDGKLDLLKDQTYLSASFGLFDTDAVQRGGASVSGNWRDMPLEVRQKVRQLGSAIVAWAVATGRLPAGTEEGDL